jgi:hypothetical protein
MKDLIREILLLEVRKKKRKKKKKVSDRCTRIAKRKYDVWPSAYASGAVVKCRQGKIWKNENLENNTEALMENHEYEDSLLIREVLLDEARKKKKKKDFSKEKEEGLHGWFARQGGKGKSKGWVDCNTCRTNKDTGRKKCKSCGRQEGETRSKYPRCRPTPSQCKGYKRPDER